jgi:hypothetical protein
MFPISLQYKYKKYKYIYTKLLYEGSPIFTISTLFSEPFISHVKKYIVPLLDSEFETVVYAL